MNAGVSIIRSTTKDWKKVNRMLQVVPILPGMVGILRSQPTVLCLEVAEDVRAHQAGSSTALGPSQPREIRDTRSLSCGSMNPQYRESKTPTKG